MSLRQTAVQLIVFLVVFQAVLFIAVAILSMLNADPVRVVKGPRAHNAIHFKGNNPRRNMQHGKIRGAKQEKKMDQFPAGKSKLQTGLLQLAKSQLAKFNWTQAKNSFNTSMNGGLFPPVERRDGEQPPFVILTATNSHFLSITENWLESLRRLQLRYNITLMAEDYDTLNYFGKRSSPELQVLSSDLFSLPGNLNRNISTYQQLIRKRTVYILSILRSGRDVLLVDVDAVWVKDPLPLIYGQYDKYDIWLAQGKQENFPCPCFFYMKSIPEVKNMAYEWVKKVAFWEKRPLTDQNALAEILAEDNFKPRVKYLNYSQFPLGSHYFNWTWNNEHKENVYVAHGNHLGREDGKIAKFKEFGVWLLNE